MAIKTSGQLSLRDDIRAEFGGGTTNISLRSLSATAGFSTPDAMSEFYGYTSNSHFIRATGSGYTMTSPTPPPQVGLGNFANISGGLWFRNNAPSKRNQQIMSIGDYRRSDGRGTDDSVIFVFYIASLNRISVQVWRNGSRTNRREYPLHDSRNSGVTGVTNSGAGWYSGQRGSADSDGFNFISFTVRMYSGGTATNNIDLYWNGRLVPYSVNNNNTSNFPITNISGNFVAIGENLRNTSVPSGGSWYGDIDDAWFIENNFGSGVHNSLWSAGKGGGVTYFNNNVLLPLSYWEFSNNTFTTIGSYDYRLSRFGNTSFVAY